MAVEAAVHQGNVNVLLLKDRTDPTASAQHPVHAHCSPCCSLLGVCSLFPRGLRILLVSFLAAIPPACSAFFQAPTLAYIYSPLPQQSIFSCFKTHITRIALLQVTLYFGLRLSHPVYLAPSPRILRIHRY